MITTALTDQKLVDRLKKAAAKGVTADERRKQRVSFVYGNLPKGSTMTRQQVEDALSKIDHDRGHR